ncbi:MAG: threonine--tRNA ligase [Alphaproteobacteria bacterium]|nr:MAG: threonine--tRNA ligase [Alphaproteobacteria bacterium]
MISLTLPDGAQKQLEKPISGLEFAGGISKSLAKKAVAIKLDGELKDLTCQIDRDAQVEIITRESEDGLALLRHDAAHVMAQAVQELFPGTQVTIGPVIENGFFYDFARNEPFHEEDLAKIEQRMRDIVDRDLSITREVWHRQQAIDYFKKQGEAYKAEIIAEIPAGEDVTIYRQGEWLDLCRGPHLPSTGKLGKAFKLTKLAGAYWRGDSRNAMLQRIYGTAWANEKDLKAYLDMLEEAEKRDHRRLGREMDLFHMQEEAPGMVFWHDKGWTLWRTIENYIRHRIRDAGYIEVHTPILIDRKLWEKSGHWEKFREHMFTSESDGTIYALKPMNCPAHVQIFNQGIKSYRDLPLRMAEFGCCHRNEPSGALHGLMRVRSMVQDDAHIFCRENQITDETKTFIDLLQSVYRDLGFTGIEILFADRPEVRVGSDEVWDRAEGALKQAVAAAGLDCKINPGEGAFYGPKLEFNLRDAIGRVWQCGTLQVDFVLPDRLGARYIGEDGERHTPVMLHRAILGSLERFIGILIEHYAGKFPLWMAPLQIVVATITSDADAYARQVVATLRHKGLRVEADLRNEKINFKVREHSVGKVPVLLVLGKREVEQKSVSIRRLGSKEQTSLSLADAVKRLKEEALSPVERPLPDEAKDAAED